MALAVARKPPGFYTIIRTLLTTVVEILDIYHAREHLWPFAEACCGERSATAQAGVEPWSGWLATAGPEPV